MFGRLRGTEGRTPAEVGVNAARLLLHVRQLSLCPLPAEEAEFAELATSSCVVTLQDWSDAAETPEAEGPSLMCIQQPEHAQPFVLFQHHRHLIYILTSSQPLFSYFGLSDVE